MDIIRLFVDDSSFQLYINNYLIYAFVLVLVIVFLYLRLFSRRTGKWLEINEAEIGVGNQKIRIKPNFEDFQIAYKLWVELSTRKIGLPIDFDHDVIIEIYKSWYEFFRLTRELIKNIPISKIRRGEGTISLVKVAIDVLNEGLRPHLTLWQARFTRWYQSESGKSENINLTPQELQKKFPDYDELISDMKKVNKNLMKYRDTLRRIALE
jgi:hypothetical protein